MSIIFVVAARHFGDFLDSRIPEAFLVTRMGDGRPIGDAVSLDQMHVCRLSGKTSATRE
jgi:hypothetical protein